MSVATKLSAGFGLLVLLMILLLVFHVRTTRQAVSTGYDLADISSRLYLVTTGQLDRLDQLEENASKYWVTRDSGYIQMFEEVADSFGASLRTLDGMSLAAPERVALNELDSAWSGFLSEAESLPTLIDSIPGDASADALLPLYDRLDRLHGLAHGLSEASRTVMLERLRGSAAAARNAERLSYAAVTVALLLSVLVAGLIVRSISDSLRRLKSGTREVASGNFDHRLDTERGDEFAQVADDFNIMTRRLGELDRMKRDFVSKVSHDLKTPLASMLETTGLLLDELPGSLNSKQRELLLLSAQSGQRLSSMIAKLLDLSALEEGALRPDLGTHDLNAMVRTAAREIRPPGHQRDRSLVLDLSAATILLECDAERLLQVIDNLLENALRLSPAGSKVEIATRFLSARPDDLSPARWDHVHSAAPDAGVLHLTVADSGPGVPDREKERIFDRFYQTEAGRKAMGRGVGLGLAITKEIVEAHHGAIWATDRDPGSTFHLLMPRALAVPRQAAPAIGAGTTAPGARGRPGAHGGSGSPS